MIEQIEGHIEKMLSLYTEGEHFASLKKAKEKYTTLTGQLDEDKPEFESRMNCFNEWYLFQYKREDGIKFIEQYLKKNQLDEQLSQAFLNLNHSLFEFQKTNYRGQIILKDILHGEKLSLDKEQKFIGLVEGDMFTGRVIKVDKTCYLLSGVCTLPHVIKGTLEKESKKIRKQGSFEEELSFLLKLEMLKTKSMNYKHIEPHKIFIFE